MKPVVAICMRTYSGMYNGKRYIRTPFLKRHLESLVANTALPHRVIVIDDASPQPEHTSFLEKMKSQGVIDQLVIKPRNLGRQHSFTMQRRLGLKSGTPFVIICDDDYEYQPGWLTTMVEAYKALRENWTGRPIGLLSGFNRENAKYVSVHEFGGHKMGMTTNWLGCRWLMGKEVIENGGHLGLSPTKNWPKKWTSPWMDDGSYQKQLTAECGFENSFILIKYPSVVEHIGSIGVHSRPGRYVKGAK